MSDQTEDQTPERQAERTGWAYAISTDAQAVTEVGIGSAVAGYIEVTNPTDEVKEHLAAARRAAEILVEALGVSTDKVVIRVAGRATPGHEQVPGPDEMITVSVSVVDVPDPVEDEEPEGAPVVVEGGSFVQVD